MKNRFAVQMLTAEQYEKLFGRLREADASPGSDPVLRWYRLKGWKSFSGLEWMLEVAKAMRLDLSKFKVLADLAKYASENMLEDLHEGNWGLTTRGGQEVLIVIDYDI